MYSIIPEAWIIQACKCLTGTVAYTWQCRWCRRIFSSLPEYSPVLHNVYMTSKLTRCVTLRFIETQMAQLTPYSKGTQEISFKLHSFETPWRLMGQWTNWSIRRTVNDGPFRHANMSRCRFEPKKKTPYWHVMINNCHIGDNSTILIPC